MPKFLPPHEVEALREKGVVFPPEAPPIPSETVARALGDIGLPHSEKVERLGSEGSDSNLFDSSETHNIHIATKNYMETYETVYKMTTLLGDQMPPIGDFELLDQLNVLKPAFEVFERYNLQPEVVMTPAHRPLEFWENLTKAVQDSPLNPDESDPSYPGGTRKLLRHGGLLVNRSLKEEWQNQTNPNNEPATWQLSISSGLERPFYNFLTIYGYIDAENQVPSNELNELLRDIGQPVLPVRASHQLSQPLAQPNFHPTPDAYLMHQLTRIVRDQEPIDISTWSWLNGTPTDVYSYCGRWFKGDGQVCLGKSGGGDGYRASDLGVRSSARV